MVNLTAYCTPGRTSRKSQRCTRIVRPARRKTRCAPGRTALPVPESRGQGRSGFSPERGDAIGTAHPEFAVVVLNNMEDAVAGKTLRGCVYGDIFGFPAKQARPARSEPQPALGIFMDRPDFLMPQSIDDGVLHKRSRVQLADTPLGADPGARPTIYAGFRKFGKTLRHCPYGRVSDCAPLAMTNGPCVRP